MNKRILVAVLALGVLSASNAFATRARVLTMGDGFGTGSADGSFFYDDAQNIFYNPAYVNDFKNWATVEKSNGSATDGNAQGGFVTSLHGFNLGMYFNRVSALGDAAIAYTAPGVGVGSMRPIDIIIGGDMGWKWGLGVTYASRKAAADLSDTDAVIKLGVSVADFEPFLHYRMIGINHVGATQGRNKMLAFGLRYHWGEWTPVLVYRNAKGEAGGVEGAGTRNLMLGLGRNMKLAEGFRLNYMAAITRQTADDTSANANNVTQIPVTMSMEGDVTSWMTARGGFTYFLLARQDGMTQNLATTGRIGATFHLGKADLDWMWGKSSPVGAFTETATMGDTQVLDLNGIFTAASLTYRW